MPKASTKLTAKTKTMPYDVTEPLRTPAKWPPISMPGWKTRRTMRLTSRALGDIARVPGRLELQHAALIVAQRQAHLRPR